MGGLDTPEEPRRSRSRETASPPVAEVTTLDLDGMIVFMGLEDMGWRRGGRGLPVVEEISSCLFAAERTKALD